MNNQQPNQQQQPQNIYFGSIKSHTFPNGDIILKQSFNAQDLANMQANLNESGYINLIIGRRQTVSEWGHTHSCKLDTWQPTPQGQQPQGQPQYQAPQGQQAPPAQQQPQQGYQQPQGQPQQQYNNYQ